MKPAPSVADALAGAQFETPPNLRSQPQRTVLVAGAAGRLGERVLARMLASSAYRKVYALADIPMPSTESKLEAVPAHDWKVGADHVVAVLEEEGATHPLPSRRRTDVFSSVRRADLLELAQRAKAAGVRSFMVVSPINVFSQPSALYAGIADMIEADLNRIGFESLLLVRPSDHEYRKRPSGIGGRILGVITGTAAGLMTGLRHTPLSIEDVARAVTRALETSPHGLNIIETDRLHALARS